MVSSINFNDKKMMHYNMMSNMPGMGGGYWGDVWLPNLLWNLVFLLIIAIILYWLFRGSIKTKEETPLEILKKRYARGEITKKEFKEMKKDVI